MHRGVSHSLVRSLHSTFLLLLLYPILSLVNNLYSMECIKYTPRAHTHTHCCRNHIYSRARSIVSFRIESNVSCVRYTVYRTLSSSSSYTPNLSFFCSLCLQMCGMCIMCTGTTQNAEQKKSKAKKDGNSGGDRKKCSSQRRVQRKNNYFLIKYIEWRCIARMRDDVERAKNATEK